MTADYSLPGGTDCSVAGSTEGFVAGGTEYFGDTFSVGSAYHHPSPLHVLPHSCKWGNVVPMSTFLQPAKASPWHGGWLQLGVDLLSSQWG